MSHFGIGSESTIKRWKSTSHNQYRLAEDEKQNALLAGRGRPKRSSSVVDFETQFVKVLLKRRQQGKAVSPSLVQHLLGQDPWKQKVSALKYDWRGKPVVFSYKWAVSFLRRHDFKGVKVGNIRPVDLQTAGLNLHNMIIKLRHFVLKEWISSVDPPIWYRFHSTEGRFPLHRRLNYDQVPLQFVFTSESKVWAHSTERKKHVGQVKVKTPGAHLAKRQATLQVAITGDPDMPQPPLTVIFRGKGKVNEEETLQYDDRIRVLWQDKAWMDRATNVRWVSGVLAPYVKAHYRVSEDSDELLETLGVSDSLDSQTTESFVEVCGTLNHRPFHGPRLV